LFNPISAHDQSKPVERTELAPFDDLETDRVHECSLVAHEVAEQLLF